MSRAVVEAFYGALARGDREVIAAALHEDFVARFDPGLPLELGGERSGEDAIDSGWWQIGRVYAMAAEPSDWLTTDDGRLVVLGTYRGAVRKTRVPISADFVHVWSFADDGRVHRLRQYTDSAAWAAALQDQGTET